MVERRENTKVERFTGILEQVETVTHEKGEEHVKNGVKNVISETFHTLHMVFKPTDPAIIDAVSTTKTKRLHNWIRLSKKLQPALIPQGCGLDVYLKDVEAVFPETKEMKTWQEVIDYLKGKELFYVSKEIGKAYEGKKARTAYTPLREV